MYLGYEKLIVCYTLHDYGYKCEIDTNSDDIAIPYDSSLATHVFMYCNGV